MICDQYLRSFAVLNSNSFEFRTARPAGTAGRSYVFAIHNAKTNEPGQEVLNERSEFRNLRQFPHFCT